MSLCDFHLSGPRAQVRRPDERQAQPAFLGPHRVPPGHESLPPSKRSRASLSPGRRLCRITEEFCRAFSLMLERKVLNYFVDCPYCDVKNTGRMPWFLFRKSTSMQRVFVYLTIDTPSQHLPFQTTRARSPQPASDLAFFLSPGTIQQ